jgi:hypothetical protein
VNTDFGETTTAVEERAPAVRRVNRRLDALIPDKVTLFGLEINGHLPEKMAVKGLQLVKVQARREDVVGEVAKRTLRIFNGSFKTIARAATRLEQATGQNSHRQAETGSKRSRRRSAHRRSA